MRGKNWSLSVNLKSQNLLPVKHNLDTIFIENFFLFVEITQSTSRQCPNRAPFPELFLKDSKWFEPILFCKKKQKNKQETDR
jgi:hypothetical protein